MTSLALLPTLALWLALATFHPVTDLQIVAPVRAVTLSWTAPACSAICAMALVLDRL